MTRYRIHWPAVTTLALFVIVSSFFAICRVSNESQAALATSDRAFDAGELKWSLVEARLGATSALEHSAVERASIERLAAIALGSEPAGRSKTALLAWMSLLTVPQASGVRLDARLSQQALQQTKYLVEKIANSAAADAAREGPARGLVLLDSSYPSALAVLLIIAAIVVSLIRLEGNSQRYLGRFASLIVPSLALTSWFIGWFIT